ncbi:hypothetical protein LTR62_006968 [Meristemomyces frigidus]|uniref:SMP domain-containing protein n=1 Tax=Meristemomyces frigidus TaxID=1508187 RepID=A0AAN7TMX3_9PEZI|nr:hypothetical protein LTR62_006968 [Meristemomyces frigidus]
MPSRETTKTITAPPTQQNAAAASVAAVNDTATQTALDGATAMARHAIEKSEALKFSITHRPKTSSPLKVSISAEPPMLPPRNLPPGLQMHASRIDVGASV